MRLGFGRSNRRHARQQWGGGSNILVYLEYMMLRLLLLDNSKSGEGQLQVEKIQFRGQRSE